MVIILDFAPAMEGSGSIAVEPVEDSGPNRGQSASVNVHGDDNKISINQ